MHHSKQNEIKVGIVSIIAIILLISVLFLTKSLDFNTNKHTILFNFDNALGLTEGAPVFINGMKSGIVEKI